MQLRKGQSLLFLSHARNVAAATESGWASIVDRLLQSVYPELDIRVDALSYAAVADGRAEPGWIEAAGDLRPDWLVLPPFTDAELSAFVPNGATMSPELLKESLLPKLIEMRMHAERVVLLSPFALNASDGEDSAPYEAAVLEAAWEAGCMLVDAKTAIDETKDKHAYQPGQANDEAQRTDIEFALASAFLRSVGFQWIRRHSFFNLGDQASLRMSHSS